MRNVSASESDRFTRRFDRRLARENPFESAPMIVGFILGGAVAMLVGIPPAGVVLAGIAGLIVGSDVDRWRRQS